MLLAAEPWVQDRRRDCRQRLLRLVRELTVRASWDTWETWPGWDQLMQASTWARSTLADWLRQLRLLGWLAVIESGSTPEYRPMSLAHITGNRRAVYALRVPRLPGEPASAGRQAGAVDGPQAETVVPGSELERQAQAAWRAFASGPPTPSDQGKRRAGEETWTPTGLLDLSSWVSRWVSTRARAIFHSAQTNTPVVRRSEALRARFDEEWFAFDHQAPATGAQMLAAAAELRRQHDVLARCSIRAVRALCRPYWAAGWTNRDVLHAMTYRPTSWSTLPAMDPAKVVAPYRWCQCRLSAWRTDSGRVLPGHTQSRHERRRREAAVVAEHGRAAAAVLPAGADRLYPADVRRRGQRQHQAAADLLRRRHAAELADARAAKTPAELAASADTRERAAAEFRAAEQQRKEHLRQRLLEQARAAATEHTQSTPVEPWTPPRPGETPHDPLELARARARYEQGRTPLTRRRPRRRR